MEKSSFIKQLKSNLFDNNIFKVYYEEVNSKPNIVFDGMHFNMYLVHTGTDINNILNNLIIPHYKRKFSINELKDKEGNRIKIIDEEEISKSN